MRNGSIATLLAAIVLLAGLCESSAIGQQPRKRTDQHEFTSPTPLLDSTGALAAWGWARRAQMQYNRDAIQAARHGRIKEWEHYTIMSPEFTVGVTIVHLGTIAAGSAELIDYRAKSIKSAMFLTAAAKDKSLLPANPYGQTRLALRDNFLSLAFADGRRTIAC